MARIYKVKILDYPSEGSDRTICFRPLSNDYDFFMEEIFKRFPELKTKQLNLFYKGVLYFFNLFIFFTLKQNTIYAFLLN